MEHNKVSAVKWKENLPLGGNRPFEAEAKGGAFMQMEMLAVPLTKILLLAVIFLSLLVEIKTGGMGVGALFGLIAAGIFFASQFVQGLVSFYEIAIFLGGILCIVLELLTPGGGIFAVLGVLAILYSFILSLGGGASAVYMLLLSLLLAAVFFGLVLKKLPASRFWSKIVLKDMSTKEKGYVSAADSSGLLGARGVVLTELRPAGTASFAGRQTDVVSEGRYIEKGAAVEVIAVQGSRIVVRAEADGK